MDALPALEGLEVSDPEEQIGIDIIKKALTAPVATIAKNAGYEGAVIVDKVSELPAGEGLNSANGEWGNMIDMGVLDPVKSPAPPCRTPPPWRASSSSPRPPSPTCRRTPSSRMPSRLLPRVPRAVACTKP